jgi:hypothetical protein
MAPSIDGDAVALVGPGAAQVAAIAEHGVNGERLAGIVALRLEAEGAVRAQPVAAGHGLANAVVSLVEVGRSLDQGAAAGLEEQVALRVEAQALGALQAQVNGGGIGARGDDEVVFELLLAVAVVDGVDARIEVVGRHLGILGDVGLPGGEVLAGEVVAAAGQFLRISRINKVRKISILMRFRRKPLVGRSLTRVSPFPATT